MSTTKTLGFYERVAVQSCADHPELIGSKGAVLGIGEEDGVIQSYGIWIDGADELFSFGPEELTSLGTFALRSDYYDDDEPHIRVAVDKEGRGRIIS